MAESNERHIGHDLVEAEDMKSLLNRPEFQLKLRELVGRLIQKNVRGDRIQYARDLAESAFGHVCLQLHEDKLKRKESPDKARSWLAIVVRNFAMSQCRLRRKRDCSVDPDTFRHLADLSAAEPIDLAEKRELTKKVGELMARLTEREQEMLRLYYGRDCEARTQDEIGKIYGVSQPQVNVILGRARLRLKRWLNDIERGEEKP